MDADSISGENVQRELSALETAAKLGVSQRTVRRAIARGELAARKVGGVYRIDLESLEAFRVTRPPGQANFVARTPEPAGSSLNATLPRISTGFIGRAAELDALCRTLLDERTSIVTLTGPGGIGKTRLALEAAQALADRFPDGVSFSDLVPIRDAGLIGSTIARTFGIDGVAGDEAVERVSRLIGNRQLLLVLDNFEHVLDAAPVVSQLVSRCPRLTVLVTSRAQLRLSGEIERVVPSLQVLVESDRSGLALPEALLLFADRASAVDSGFELTAQNIELIAAICDKLDGLPLAIELAAARVKVLSLTELQERLKPALPLLTGGPRDRPGHQQTVRDTIAWSYGLLAPAEQQLFRQLAVFVGGFSLPAAEAVAEGTQQSIVDGLTTLAHQSLLAQETGIPEETRYTMLETVREFGLEQLSARGEEAAVRERHAKWLIELSARARTHWEMADFAHWLDRQELDRGNLRAALSWTIECRNAELSYALVIESNRFWRARGPVGEGIAWLEAVLELPAPSLWERTEVLELIADHAAMLGDVERAIARGHESVQLARRLGDSVRLDMALSAYGRAWLMCNEPDEAIPLLQEAIGLARTFDLRAHLASDLSILGVAVRMRGDPLRAIAMLEESLEIARAESFVYIVSGITETLGDPVRQIGDLARARSLYQEGLRLGLEQNEQRNVAVGLAGLAILSVMEGCPERAARLCGAIDTVMQRVGTALTPGGRENYEVAVREARMALGAEQFDRLWQEGGSIPPAEFLLEPPPADTRSAADPNGLTRRELEVLRLLAEGKSDREIGNALFISPHTAGNHVSSILSKLGVHSRSAAAALAVRRGIAQSSP